VRVQHAPVIAWSSALGCENAVGLTSKCEEWNTLEQNVSIYPSEAARLLNLAHNNASALSFAQGSNQNVYILKKYYNSI
jgi:hypothetical protein